MALCEFAVIVEFALLRKGNVKPKANPREKRIRIK